MRYAKHPMTDRAARLVAAALLVAALGFVSACNEDKEDPSKFKPVNAPSPAAPATNAPAPTNPPPAAPPAAAPALTPDQARSGTLPPGHPPVDGMTVQAAEDPATKGGASASAPAKDEPKLDGLKVVIPLDWKAQAPSSGAFGPKLQYGLPRAEGDAEDAVVKIFHYPNMKGKEKDDANITRWIGQMELPADAPKPEVRESTRGEITIKLLDMTGTFKGGGPMMGGGTAVQSDYRMIAAIVDHPAGPHHVKITGPKATVEKWKASIDKFFESIKPTS